MLLGIVFVLQFSGAIAMYVQRNSVSSVINRNLAGPSTILNFVASFTVMGCVLCLSLDNEKRRK